MQQVVKGIDKRTCLFPLGDFDSVLHGVECEVESILGALVRLVMLKLALVHELAHLLLVRVHVESVRFENYEANPSPCEAEH